MSGYRLTPRGWRVVVVLVCVGLAVVGACLWVIGEGLRCGRLADEQAPRPTLERYGCVPPLDEPGG